MLESEEKLQIIKCIYTNIYMMNPSIRVNKSYMIDTDYTYLLMDIMKDIIRRNGIYYKTLKSYTTRDIRSNETDGIDHYFITDKEANDYLSNKDDILAYTKINGNRYFTLKRDLNDCNIYLIDPKAIDGLKSNHSNIRRIYIYCGEETRKSRCYLRSDYHTKFQQRCDDEDEQFSKCEDNKDYDIMIYNEGLYQALTTFNSYIITEMLNNKEDSNILFCIMGRTGSGKDTIINYSIEILDFINQYRYN